MSPTENPSLLMLLLAYNEDARILLLRATNALLFVDGDEVKRRSDTRRDTFVTTFMFDDLMVIYFFEKNGSTGNKEPPRHSKFIFWKTAGWDYIGCEDVKSSMRVSVIWLNFCMF